MTIKEYIIDGTRTSLQERWYKLRDMDAPAVMLTGIADEISKLDSGELKCSGDTDLLYEEMKSVEQKKGRGGIPYYTFNGNINYFPKAKYGRFIAKGEVK